MKAIPGWSAASAGATTGLNLPCSASICSASSRITHIAVRKILQGVKDRVAGRVEPMARSNLEFAGYVVAALIFCAALVLTLLRPLTLARWLAGLAAGAVWLITWYAPIAPWPGIALEIFVCWG